VKRFPPISFDKKGKQTEVANLVLGDIHVGMINKVYDGRSGTEIITYNDEIRKKQEQMLVKGVAEIHRLLSHSYHFEKLKIYLLGDIITNDRIFEGQQFEISKCVGLQIWQDALVELADMIKYVASMFPQTEVYCVVGNHGRSTQVLKSALNEPVQNNLEYHLYRALKLMLEQDKQAKIKVIVPDSRFYSTQTYDHKIFFSHGDTIRGMGTAYLEKRAKELLINLPHGYNVYLLGHRHKHERISIAPDAEVVVNGSWIKQDSYSFDLYGVTSKPVQLFFGTSPKRAISWLFNLDFQES
jgi:UDP-2,3-diacylglucosamine pyrophosphatase LpxH